MESKEKYNHFFFDGYEIKNEFLSNINIIKSLLSNINKIFFDNNGNCILISCFNNDNPLDDGISGIILGNNSHFTCHTFNNRNTFFVDLFCNKINNDDIVNILKKTFEVKKYDLCIDNKLTGKFGKHIIIKSNYIEYEKSLKLIDKLISNINMHPIYDKICNISKNGYDILRPIAESHISIHSYNNESIIDIFSCNTFNEDLIFKELNNVLSIEKVERGVYLQKH